MKIEQLLDKAQEEDYGNICADNSILELQNKAQDDLKAGKDFNDVLDEYSCGIIELYRNLVIRYAKENNIVLKEDK